MALRGENNNGEGPGGGSLFTEEELAEMMRLGSQLSSESSGSTQDAGRVFMGTVTGRVQRMVGDPTQYLGDRTPPRTTTTRHDRWLTRDEAVLEFFGWDARRRADFIAQGKISGLLTPEAGELEASRLWEQLVVQASAYGARDVRITPFDILGTYVRQSGTSETGWRRDPSNPDFEVNMLTGERRYIGPRFRTQTETAVNLTDPATAKAIATSVFQQFMGRDPGEGELSSWADALRAAEQAAPVTRSTTTEHDPVTGEIVGSNSTTSGGLDSAGREYLARERVQDTQEYADVQAATTYANALENAVWGAPQLGA